MRPSFAFDAELFPAGAREAVEARASVFLGQAPFAVDPAHLLDAVEGGIEGAFFDAGHVVRELLDAAADAVAVRLAEAQGFEDEEVERALGKIRLLLHGSRVPLCF